MRLNTQVRDPRLTRRAPSFAVVARGRRSAARATPWAARQGRLQEPMPLARPSLIEFPADDPERARRFWSGVLGLELEPRREGEGEGWQTHTGAPAIGVHVRGRGPGDSFSLPYFAVDDLVAALERVSANGGAVVHPPAGSPASAREARSRFRRSPRAGEQARRLGDVSRAGASCSDASSST
jgi:uncharacterized protein